MVELGGSTKLLRPKCDMPLALSSAYRVLVDVVLGILFGDKNLEIS
jgi:hypothetical protein